VSFLQSIDSPLEIEECIKANLGNNKLSNTFSKKYLNYRRERLNTNNAKEPLIDDLNAPAKAINPTATHDVNQKKKKEQAAKKFKKNMKAVDAKILGFKGTADSDRIVGELDVPNQIQND
jgi:coenzyme F420-reducing hydrogenase alpha subunit